MSVLAQACPERLDPRPAAVGEGANAPFGRAPKEPR